MKINITGSTDRGKGAERERKQEAIVHLYRPTLLNRAIIRRNLVVDRHIMTTSDTPREITMDNNRHIPNLVRIEKQGYNKYLSL